MSKVETTIEQICFVGFSKGSAWKQLRLLLQTSGLKKKLFHHPQGSPLSTYNNGTIYLIAENNPQAGDEIEYLVRKQISAWKTPAADSFQDDNCPIIGRIKSRGQNKLKALALYLALIPSETFQLSNLCGWGSESIGLSNPGNIGNLQKSKIWQYLSPETHHFSREILLMLQGQNKQSFTVEIVSDGNLEISQFKITAPQTEDQAKFLETRLQAMYNQSSHGEYLGLQINIDKSVNLWLIRDRFDKKIKSGESSATLIVKDLQQTQQILRSTPTTRRAS